MHIAIMSRNKNLYSTSRLKEAAEARGHVIKIVDPLKCYMNINMNAPSIHVRGEELPKFDAVIPRIGASVTFYGTAVLRQFEMMGTHPLNESVAITRSRDKLRSLQLLSRKNIGLPVTGKAAESVIEAFMGLKANIMVQEYIAEAGGADIRCFVIGDKVIAAMKRQALPGEFRSNLHRGGSASIVKLTPEERSTALRAAKTMGLNVAGVDILRSKHGPLVMEVNSSPGLEGIEKATGIDVAEKIIQFIEKNVKSTSSKTKGVG